MRIIGIKLKRGLSAKKDWLETFLELSNGIPSHDTFNRVFSAIDPQAFFQCFSSWVHTIGTMTEVTVIATGLTGIDLNYALHS